MKLLLTLGPGFDPAPHGDIVVLDWSTKRIIDGFRYAHRVYPHSHKGLSGASWTDEGLIVCTEAEVLQFTVAPLALVRADTHPSLNDVHHAAATADRIWVANTGQDCIEELTRDWTPVATHQLVPTFGRRAADVVELLKDDFVKSWKRLKGDYEFYGHLTKRPPFRNVAKLVDPLAYRRGDREARYSDLRPHVLHPNHVWPTSKDVLVTLWRTGRIVSLRSREVVATGLGRPHDGIRVDDRFYVTDCARNRLLVYEWDAQLERPSTLLAARPVTKAIMEGFLRGVCAMGDRVFVGLTARRGATGPFRKGRILALDRATLESRDEWVVPDEYGANVFSVVDATARYS